MPENDLLARLREAALSTACFSGGFGKFARIGCHRCWAAMLDAFLAGARNG